MHTTTSRSARLGGSNHVSDSMRVAARPIAATLRADDWPLVMTGVVAEQQYTMADVPCIYAWLEAGEQGLQARVVCGAHAYWCVCDRHQTGSQLSHTGTVWPEHVHYSHHAQVPGSGPRTTPS